MSEQGPLTGSKYDYMSVEQLEEEIDCLKQDIRCHATDFSIVQHCKNELDLAEAAYLRIGKLRSLVAGLGGSIG